MTEHKVQIEVFEGPLDLLLYLVKKEEVDIYEVNLTKIATQFLEYIEVMRQLDLEIAGEFLVMAATLISKQICSFQGFIQSRADPEPSASPGPGTSLAPLSEAKRRRPPSSSPAAANPPGMSVTMRPTTSDASTMGADTMIARSSPSRATRIR
jgi:segregation and condensation protein A